jgi:hypothetical protein
MHEAVNAGNAVVSSASVPMHVITDIETTSIFLALRAQCGRDVRVPGNQSTDSLGKAYDRAYKLISSNTTSRSSESAYIKLRAMFDT